MTYFRIPMNGSGVYADADPVIVKYPGSRQITVKIKNDPNMPYRRMVVVPSVALETNKYSSILDGLRQASLPRGYIMSDGLLYTSVETAESFGWPPCQFIEVDGVALQPFQSFAEQLRRELAGAATRVWRLFRWRFGSESMSSHLDSTGLQFSFDGDEWYNVPMKSELLSRVSRGRLDLANHDRIIESMLGSGASAPLAHDLLQEARDLFFGNTRASLIMTLSAVEVGYKKLVGDLVPHAKWIVEESPTPPLVPMLRDHLPTLPARLKFQGIVLSPPSRILNRFRDGVGKRNKLVHSGGGSVDGSFLLDLLNCASDTLFLLDYYAGNEWAIDNLSWAMRTELGLVSSQPE